MEKITLVCTSLGKNPGLLQKMVDSAKGFDEILVHIDKQGGTYFKNGCVNGFWDDPFHHSIPDAYNKLIHMANTEWICCFCDDDYFYSSGLRPMIDEVHKGIDADVAHFGFMISGHAPFQDLRCWLGKKQYILSEKDPITTKLLERHNRLPAASFFRKSAWEKVGGFQGDKCHDWDLWKRMAQAGLKFKKFNYLVYNFVRRKNSAWCRQNA